MLEIGELVDERYRVEKYVGSGGFGDTYRAYDLKAGQLVALTLGSAELGDRVREAFLRDSSLLGRITSPYVAVARTVGELPDGRNYLVRDWVEGTPLRQIIQQQRLEVSQALDAGIALARGLRAAHAVNVLHRDIKPDNVVIPPGEGGYDFARARLMDFGVRGELEQETQTTRTGQFFGTPHYMSPEQLSGGRQSAASDIYGLGLVLYEMLHGQRPFDGNTIQAIFLSRMQGEISRIYDTRVPHSLDELVRRCLEREPERRPQSADSLIEDLERERWLLPHAVAREHAGTMAAGRTTGSIERPTRPAGAKAPPAARGRTRRLWIPVVAGILVLGTTLVVLNVQSPTSGMPGPIAPSRFTGRHVALTVFLLVMVALVPGAFLVHRKLTKSLLRQRTRAGDQAFKALSHAKDRDLLTTSLALEVDQLLENCRLMDQGILEASVALLINEVQTAQKSGDRQSALMNLLKVLDKITARLSPWYVRHAKLVAFVGSALTMLTGVLGAAKTVQDLTRPPATAAEAGAGAATTPR